MEGNTEVGLYPGSSMTPEGGGWFYFTYKTLNKLALGQFPNFNLVDWIGPSVWQGYVSYSRAFRIDSLFAPFPSLTNELWIAITDTNVPAQVYDRPPEAKVLYLLNPWPNNSPQMIIGDGKPLQMRSRLDICGWYAWFFMGTSDSLWNVKFTDYFHMQQYTAAGLISGQGIDLRPILSAGDTVYILPSPFPNGPPELSATFPGKTGECGFRRVTGLFRDWQLDTLSPNPSFFNNPLGMFSLSGHKNMVQNTLMAPDYRPEKTTDPNVNVTCLGHLETWYVTQTFPSGSSRATNDTSIDLVFQKTEDGRWEYNSDWFGGFFPLDSFINPNNIKYYDRIGLSDTGGHFHNYHFTMEMHLQFVYHQGANLDFDFSGDDDIWVFINNRLAIDLGGLNNNASDTLYLDHPKTDLGLVDGNMYMMDIFYAEREPIGANFRIKTSLDIQNAGTGTCINKTKLLHARPLKKACKIIQMGAVSGKYFSMTGRKLDRKNISPQPLVKVQDK
jgi:fibro-slime domain-containing protein